MGGKALKLMITMLPTPVNTWGDGIIQGIVASAAAVVCACWFDRCSQVYRFDLCKFLPPPLIVSFSFFFLFLFFFLLLLFVCDNGPMMG